MLGVIIAVKDEAAAILANAAYRWEAGGLYYSASKQIILSICGIGKANAAFALGRIFDRADEILMFGTAGALGAAKIGELYLCTEFVEHDITPFSGLPSAVISAPNSQIQEKVRKICRAENLELKEGRILSGNQVICSQELAKEKTEQFGGQLADMESAAAAKICQRLGKPFCAVRYITDNADSSAEINWRQNVKTSADIFDRILLKLVEQ